MNLRPDAMVDHIIAIGLVLALCAIVTALVLLERSRRALRAELAASLAREDRVRFALDGAESIRKELSKHLDQRLRREQDLAASLRRWHELDSANQGIIQRLRTEVQRLQAAIPEQAVRAGVIDFDLTAPSGYPELDTLGGSAPMPLDLLPPETWRRTRP